MSIVSIYCPNKTKCLSITMFLALRQTKSQTNVLSEGEQFDGIRVYYVTPIPSSPDYYSLNSWQRASLL